MPYIKRKRTIRSFKRNGKGRSYGRRRPTKSFRKGRRPVYKAKRRSTTRVPRPTASSIFRTSAPTTFIDFATSNFSCSAGIQSALAFCNSPASSDLQTLFNQGFNGSYNHANALAGTAGYYGDHDKVALEVSRRNEFQWGSNQNGYLTVYRLQARSNVPTSVCAATSSAINSYITNLWNASDLIQLSGTAASNFTNVIGATPYQSTSLCTQFKICKVTKRFMRPGSKWANTWKCKPRIYNAYDIINYGILKGSYIDLYVLRGELGKYDATATVTANRGLTTTTPAEILYSSKWTYKFAVVNESYLRAETYINAQIPSDLNAGASAGADDAHVHTITSNTLVSTTSLMD